MHAFAYLRIFAARGRGNCGTAAAFGAATLPPAGRQECSPNSSSSSSCDFSPLRIFIPPLLYSCLLCSFRGIKEDLLQAAFADVSTAQYIRLFCSRLLQTGFTRCASGSNLTLISFDSSAGNNETDKEGWGWREGMMGLERKLGY